MKKKNKLLSLSAILLIFCGICLVFIWSTTTYSRYKYEKQEALLSELEIFAACVKGGTLKPDKSGDIVLPPHWAKLTKNGHVYLTSAADEPLVLLFPTEVNGRLIAGFVYCQFPLPAKDKWGNRWLTFSKIRGVKIYPLDETAQFRKEHPYWYYGEPFYS